MTNNSLSDKSLVLAIDIGTTSLKGAFVSATGEVFSFKRIEYSRLNRAVGADFKNDSNCLDEPRDLQDQIKGGKNRLAKQEPLREKNGAAAWARALSEILPDPLSLKCDAVSVSGNGPTIVSENGTTLLWREDCGQAARTEAFGGSLFYKLDIPDAQKKIYAPRLAAFSRLFADDWKKSERLFTSTQWLCDFIKKNAEALGLADGIPVFDAGPDFIASLVGTRTLFSGRVCDRAGSSEGVNLCSHVFFEEPGLRTMSSPAKGLWNVSCLIEDPGSSSQEKADNFTKAFNALKDAAAAHGVGPLGEFVVTGGQARDISLLQAKSDSVGFSAMTAQIPDAELLGGAAAAFFRLGIYSSLEEAAEKIVRLKKAFVPKNDERLRASCALEPCEDFHLKGCSPVSFERSGPVGSSFPGESSAQKFPRFYNMPSDFRAIIFDIDSTLYTNEAYAFEQVDCQVRRFASLRSISNDEARKMVADYRKKFARENGGKKVSLSNTLAHFGVSIDQSVQWRRELIEPSDFLGKDKELRDALVQLSKKLKLICVTNNPILPAKKTLAALGIEDLILDLIGLDTLNLSKPAKEPFELAAKRACLEPCQMASVGDRYDLDLAPALELGMGGVLVGGVEDVYKLPELLLRLNRL